MADQEDDAQKTEEPTEKKLAKAREKGQIASSQEVKSWAVLLAGTGAIMFMAPFMADEIRQISTPFIAKPHDIPFSFESIRGAISDVSLDLAAALAPFAVLVMVFAAAGNILQSGFLLAPEKIKPDFSKLSLIAGVKRMFSAKGIAEFLKGIFKLVIVAAVSFGLSLPLMDDLDIMPGLPLHEILDRLLMVGIIIMTATVAVMTAIAALDFAFQKMQFTKQMRMSKQELKDEHKQAEGDPQVKAKIRALRQQRARERMMANVPDADVVITNPTHFAVALQYNMEEMAAPKLVAKGIDSLAFRIREVAEENDIPIVENPPLARALHAAVELDGEVPPEHFVAVAEVIGYVMRMKGKTLH